MKKLCILMALVVMCTLLFSSCDNNTNNANKTDGTSVADTTAQSTTLSADDAATVAKETENAKKCIETLILSKDINEMKKITRNAGDEYFQDVITGFPYDDYIVKAEKLGEYKGNVIFYIEVERAAEGEGDEYYFDGIQIFARSENGLLIELDTAIEDEVVEKFHCRSCNGSGVAGRDKVYGLEYKCDICHGKGFVF